MSINPDDITAIRVDQLAFDPITATSLLPHQVGTDLKQDTVQSLIDLISTAIGAGSGVGYLALSVTDGQQLPDVPENPSFFLCGAGTYLNVGGYPDVVCTEQLNAVMSLADHWELAVGIPIVGFSPNLQQVTDVGNTTTNDISITNDNTKGVGISPLGFITINSTSDEGKNATIDASLLTIDRGQMLPNKDGIFCIVDIADNFTNDTTASAGGIAIGQYYHTAGVVKIRLT
ncbi:MAG: Flavobacterium phage 11b [Bacteroidota bacterium]|jgi:hypothetical protein